MKMVDKTDKKLSISNQAELLTLNRSVLYYKPVSVSEEEYRIKWLIDEIYTKHPEFGYRRMTTLKWEKLYLEEYETGHQLRKIIIEYIENYNNFRPHQSLNDQTPVEQYINSFRELNPAV